MKNLSSFFLISVIIQVYAVSENVDIYMLNRLTKTDGRRPTFTEALKLLSERKAKVLVETGTARGGNTNFDGDGGSTIIFGHWAHNNNAKMFSVDINKENIENAQKATTNYSKNLSFSIEDSVKFLKDFTESINFLYLDSFDYEENNPCPAQNHALKEIIAAYDKLDDESIVMIDDCNIPGGGKGKLAIEFLLERGWYKHTNRHQVILLKKK